METNTSEDVKYTFAVFKSYYVVWKLTKAEEEHSNSLRLNRTMQYGNPGFRLYLCFEEKLFKSYYVVWKLLFFLFSIISFSSFKSYYVVWKLFFPESAFFAMPGFKSYYVVWKLLKLFFHSTYLARLNRTMQYGNLDLLRKGK